MNIQICLITFPSFLSNQAAHKWKRKKQTNKKKKLKEYEDLKRQQTRPQGANLGEPARYYGGYRSRVLVVGGVIDSLRLHGRRSSKDTILSVISRPFHRQISRLLSHKKSEFFTSVCHRNWKTQEEEKPKDVRGVKRRTTQTSGCSYKRGRGIIESE